MGGGNFSDSSSAVSASNSGGGSSDREMSAKNRPRRKKRVIEADNRSYVSRSSLTSIDKTNLLITAIQAGKKQEEVMADIIDNEMQGEAKKQEGRKSASSETLNLSRAKELWAKLPYLKVNKFAGPNKSDARSGKASLKSATAAAEPKAQAQDA